MSADDFVARARALFLDGRHADAVRVCRLGLLAQPSQHAGRMVLGHALLALGKYDEVLNEMRVVLAARPEEAAAHALKGEALLRKGDRRQAAEVLARGKQLDPLSARITGLLDELGRLGVRAPDPDNVPEPVSPSGEFSARFAALMPRAGSIDMSAEPTNVPRPPSAAVEIASADMVEVSETDGPTGIRKGLSHLHEDDPTNVNPQRPVSQARPAPRPAPRPTPPPPPSKQPLAGTRPAPLRPAPPKLADFAPGETETSAPTGVRGDATSPELDADDWNRLPTGLASALDSLELSTPVPPPAAPPPVPARHALPLKPLAEPPPPPPPVVKPAPALAPPPAAQKRRRTSQVPPPGQKERPRAVPARVGAEPRPQGGRPLVWLLAFLFIAGGAVGGYFWRQWRIAGRVGEVMARARAAEARQTNRGAADARGLWATARGAAPDDRLVRAGQAHALASFAFELGDPLEPVAAEVERVKDDARADALLARAYVALASGDDDAALAAARVAKAALPEDPEAAYVLGRALLMKDDLDDAVGALTEAARKGSPRARVWLAEAQADAGRMEAAKATLAQAPVEHPLVIIVGASLAARAGTLGTRAPSIRRELEALLADQAGAAPALGPAERRLAELALGEVALATGDEGGARKHFEAIESTDAGDDRHDAEARFAAWLAMGDKERAREVAGATARAYTTWPGSARMLGELALLDGQPQPALVVLDKVAGPRAQVLRGRAHLALGHLDDAARELDAALAQRPGDREANLARAGIDWKRGDARAVVLRLDALWKATQDPEVGVLLGAALRVTGDRDGARAVLERATQDPRGQDGWLDLARVYRADGKLTAAQEAYAKALTRDPGSVDVRLELALVAFDGGDAERARAALDALAAEKPTELNVLLACARLRSATGDPRGARACLAQAGPLATTVVQRGALAREQGRASLTAGDGGRAVAELGRTAIDDGEGRLLYLDAALMQDDARRMAAVVAEIGKTFAGRPEADVARAKVQMAAGDYEHARATFATAEGSLTTAGSPPRVIAEVRAQAARAELEDGEAETAARTAAAALALDSWNPTAHLVLGRAHLARGNAKDARPELERATQLRPGDADTWYWLAETCVRLRDLPAAKKAARTAIILSPRGTYARNAKLILRLRLR